ncbi:hypothetical protein BKA69DRAFT_1090041 [Paraphysoderma sedebokerense]|nr:hypothetical protein BKA69DRAFT_1097304 [Paraphysoderma sedebokerense]KAI9138684.1 hypothetical protein BKA69DRAFT_1090041 [Paraphysoderma sedebokerense]
MPVQLSPYGMPGQLPQQANPSQLAYASSASLPLQQMSMQNQGPTSIPQNKKRKSSESVQSSLVSSDPSLNQNADSTQDTVSSAQRNRKSRKTGQAQSNSPSSPDDISISDEKDTGKKGKKKAKGRELLSEQEKKKNHILSEQKRRQNIRAGFDMLVELVPNLSQLQRSEAVILQKSVEYIKTLLDEKDSVKERVRNLKIMAGELPEGAPEEYSSSDEEDPSKTSTTKIRTYRRTVFNNNKRRK